MTMIRFDTINKGSAAISRSLTTAEAQAGRSPKWAIDLLRQAAEDCDALARLCRLKAAELEIAAREAVS